MPVWLSVIAYSLLMAAIGGAIYKNKKDVVFTNEGAASEYDEKSIGLFFAIASFALIVYFVGNRSWIFDTTDYTYWFDIYYSDDLNQITEIIKGTKDVKGPLFVINLILFKHFISQSYNDWFMVTALIQAVFLAVFLCKYSINFTFSIFLLYFTNAHLWFVNGMRQFLAITLILFFTDLIKKRKTVLFLIVVVIAYFIHSSAIIWIPVYFIINFKPWSKQLLICTSLLVIALIGLSKSSILGGSDYAYVTSETSIGINPIRLLIVSIPMGMAYIKRNEIAEKATPFINICINLSVITSGCYLAAMFGSVILGRMAAYFEFYNLLLLPWMLKNAFYEDMSRTMTIACVVGYIAYCFYNLVICCNGIYNSDPLHIYFNNNTLFG